MLRFACMGVAAALCRAAALHADSIVLDGQTHENVLVTESASLYYVAFPDTGQTRAVAKTAVDPASVFIEADPGKRQMLRDRFNAARPPAPEPSVPRPRLIRERLPVPSPEAEEGMPEPASYQQEQPQIDEQQQESSPPPQPAWRQSRLQPNRPRTPNRIPQARVPGAPEAQPEQPSAEAEAVPQKPTLTPPGEAYRAPEPETPVMLEHETYTDPKGVKTLVVRGNRERDPGRDAAIAASFQRKREAEAQAQAEQAAWEAQQAAEEQMAAQAYLDSMGYGAWTPPMSLPSQRIVQQGTDLYVVEEDPASGDWYAPDTLYGFGYGPGYEY